MELDTGCLVHFILVYCGSAPLVKVQSGGDRLVVIGLCSISGGVQVCWRRTNYDWKNLRILEGNNLKGSYLDEDKEAAIVDFQIL